MIIYFKIDRIHDTIDFSNSIYFIGVRNYFINEFKNKDLHVTVIQQYVYNFLMQLRIKLTNF